MTLVESNGKKARFLREAVRTLQLDERARGRIAHRGARRTRAYDAITARALATLAVDPASWAGTCSSPVASLLAMKGARPDDEIAALPSGWRLQSVHALTVPGWRLNGIWWWWRASYARRMRDATAAAAAVRRGAA